MSTIWARDRRRSVRRYSSLLLCCPSALACCDRHPQTRLLAGCPLSDLPAHRRLDFPHAPRRASPAVFCPPQSVTLSPSALPQQSRNFYSNSPGRHPALLLLRASIAGHTTGPTIPRSEVEVGPPSYLPASAVAQISNFRTSPPPHLHALASHLSTRIRSTHVRWGARRSRNPLI